MPTSKGGDGKGWRMEGEEMEGVGNGTGWAGRNDRGKAMKLEGEGR